MVRAMDLELSRLGDGLETTQAARDLEYAVPEPARRGRRPLPRCEHNLVADRCHLCNPENKLPLSIFHREKERKIFPVKENPMPKDPPDNVIAKRVGY